MPDAVAQGTILVRGDALLPRSMTLEGDAYSKDWNRIVVDRSTLEGQIQDAGWSFFYLAGERKGSAFGTGENATRRALAHIIKQLDPEAMEYNCLEVTAAKTSQLLGLSFVTVTAHSRHIQAGASSRLLELHRKEKNECP